VTSLSKPERSCSSNWSNVSSIYCRTSGYSVRPAGLFAVDFVALSKVRDRVCMHPLSPGCVHDACVDHVARHGSLMRARVACIRGRSAKPAKGGVTGGSAIPYQGLV
jgi:hypothetical protein